MTKSRPNQKYIIVAVLADLIIRLTFTGDIGTLFPYLTLEKFSFTRQNYGLLIGVRQLCQGAFLLLSYTLLIRSRRSESIVAQVGNLLYILGTMGMFATWYVLHPTSLIWLSNILMGCGSFGLVFIKSRGSEFVSGKEKGRLFSLMASSESLSQGLSTVFFSWVFKSTVASIPTFNYLCLAAFVMVDIVLFRFISDKDEDDPIPELPESLKPEVENTLSYDE